MAFSWLDLVVVVVYLAAITAFGAHFGKSQRTLRDYFLGGRRLEPDVEAFARGYITLTPMTLDTTAPKSLSDFGALQTKPPVAAAAQ